MSKPPRILILITLLIFVGGAYYFFRAEDVPQKPPVHIEQKQQPFMGSETAPVSITLFEEPKCPDCRYFEKNLLPILKRDYIDQGKVKFTTIIVSFLPDSMPLANALYCVYEQNPEEPNSPLFYQFLHNIYEEQPTAHQNLMEIAKETSNHIDLTKLTKCDAKMAFKKQIKSNTNYARKVMNGRLVTPALFVNGVRVDDLTYAHIQKQIEEGLPK